MKHFFKKIIVAILCFEANILLSRQKPKIIAVTGSVGKTTTKDAIYTVLKDHIHTRKSQKSFNSEIGVPLSVLGLENGWNNPVLWLKNIIDGAVVALFTKDYPAVLVLEMGVDRPGDMKQMTSWIAPDITVLTRFPDVPVHVEYFHTPQAVVTEKMTLVHALKPDGVVIYNHDDVVIRAALQDLDAKVIGFSNTSPSQFVASDSEYVYSDGKPAGITFNITHINTVERVTLQGSLGEPQLYTVAAAIAVGSQFGITVQEAVTALAAQVPSPGRLRLVAGKSDSTIIDDSYNSSPVAVEKSLDTLQALNCDGRKIAILGDMLELGQYSVREHERVGEQVARVVDVLVTIGLRSAKTAATALKAGMPNKCVQQFEDTESALAALIDFAKPGDIILVKASQGIRAEKVVKLLMKQPAEAAQLLVRQSPMWDKR